MHMHAAMRGLMRCLTCLPEQAAAVQSRAFKLAQGKHSYQPNRGWQAYWHSHRLHRPRGGIVMLGSAKAVC